MISIATPPINEAALALDHTTVSGYLTYVMKIRENKINALYTVCLICAWTRFFFALKVSSTLGPFIKILKLNAQNILIWLIFFIIVLLSASNLFVILSS